MAAKLEKELQEFIQYRNAYFMAFSVATGFLSFGWDGGMLGGILALPSFQKYFGLLSESASVRATSSGNIASATLAGALFGSLSSSYFSSRFGRKPTLLASAVISIVGSIIQATVGIGISPHARLQVLYFSRIFGGVGIGSSAAAMSSYIPECAPRTIRGRCQGSIAVAAALGNMLASLCSTSHQGKCSGACHSLPSIIPGALFLFLMLFQPESPRWLVERGRYEEAAAVLAYIARKDPSDDAVVLTLSEIRADFVGRHNLSLLAQIRKMGESKTIALRCIIPSLAMLFQQWCGSFAISFYTPQIFASLGLSPTLTLLTTGILGVVKFIVACITFTFIIDNWGRKKPLIYGGIVQGLMMLWIGGYAGAHHDQRVVPATYISVVAIFLYSISFGFGWGFAPQVLSSEVAPGHLRTVVMSLASAMIWVFTYVIAEITPIILERMAYGTYLVFGVISFIMAAWVYVFIPETTGYPLEDIKYLFEKDIIVRSLEDAPGGWIFLGKRRATTVHELKAMNACSTDSSKEVWKEFMSHSREESAQGHSLSSQKPDGHII
ncbi:general substrate transporter [Suillus paluster]|uniref:general substrate transporter n=1 Tax=Suillus paluster TaxID=48578 RepID=UPI001B86FD4E|nr:general substrate transporter [Suillus paluster]KAG1737142.1 general substrate transporter [Suillus paluster]